MTEKESYSDNALLADLNQGSHHAFDALYERYWDRLFVKAFRVLGKKEEAEDIVQNVFLDIWKRRESLKVEGALPAYLDNSVRYMTIRFIERSASKREYLAMLADMAAHAMPASSELHLHFKDAQQIISHVVASMPPKMQEVYKLSREAHLSHQEIAARLGISPETVKKHIQHALQLIKAALGLWFAELLQILHDTM